MPTHHTAGDIVWAKLKGYPFWPSRVENDKELSDEVLRSKPPGRSQSVPVLFLGTFDYGWIAPDNLRSFQEHLAQYSKLPKRDKHFEQAIQQALDPDQIEAVLEERRRAADAADENDDEDDEEEEEEEEEGREGNDDDEKETNSTPTGKPGRPGRRRATEEPVEAEEEDDYQEEGNSNGAGRRGSLAGRKKKAVTPLKRGKEPRAKAQASKRRRGAVAYSSEEENNTSGTIKERRRNTKRGKTVETNDKSPQPESPHIQFSASKSNETATGTARSTDRPKPTGKFSLKDENPYSRLMYLRHRLQKIVLRENIESEDLVKCGAIMSDIEIFPVDLALLMETKIGKLMRRITQLNLVDDPVDLVGRARGLTQRWRTLLEEAPKSPLSPVTPTVPIHFTASNHASETESPSHLEQDQAPTMNIRVTEEETLVKSTKPSDTIDAMDTDGSEPKAEPNGLLTTTKEDKNNAYHDNNNKINNNKTNNSNINNSNSNNNSNNNNNNNNKNEAETMSTKREVTLNDDHIDKDAMDGITPTVAQIVPATIAPIANKEQQMDNNTGNVPVSITTENTITVTAIKRDDDLASTTATTNTNTSTTTTTSTAS